MFSGLRGARADLATMNRLFPEAERLAHRDGIDEPGAEHLLIAALDLLDESGRRALQEFGIDGNQVHEAMIAQHQEALHGIGIGADDNAIDALVPPPQRPRGPYRSTPAAQALFRRATELARRDRSPLLSGHVVLAATEVNHGTLARIFDHLAIDPHHLKDIVEQALAASRPGS